MDCYVTICPSGLESVMQQIIHDSIVSTLVHPALSSASNAGNSVLNSEGNDDQMKSRLYHECQNMTILNEPISKEDLERIRTKLCAQKLKKEHRQQKRKMKAGATNLSKSSVEPSQSSPSPTTHTRNQYQSMRKSNDHRLYGTVRIENAIGATPQSPSNSNDKISEINIGYNVEETTLSYPGCLEGKSLIYFETSAPPKVIYSIRASGCGPLLTMITSTCHNKYFVQNKTAISPSSSQTTTSSTTNHFQQPSHYSNPFLQYDDDLDKAITLFESFLKDTIGRDEYLQQLDKALSL